MSEKDSVIEKMFKLAEKIENANLINRMVELEKKYQSNIQSLIDKWTESEQVNIDKLRELRKEIAELKEEFETLIKKSVHKNACIELMEEHNKQIAELKSRIEDDDSELERLSLEFAELKGLVIDNFQLKKRMDLVIGVQTQIDEVKEVIDKNAHVCTNNENKICYRIKDFESVLTDLGELMKLYLTPKDWNGAHFIEGINIALKRLSSGEKDVSNLGSLSESGEIPVNIYGARSGVDSKPDDDIEEDDGSWIDDILLQQKIKLIAEFEKEKKGIYQIFVRELEKIDWEDPSESIDNLIEYYREMGGG